MLTWTTPPRARAALGVALAATLLSACVPEFATDLSELREPRLLAIASDPPETAAGKPVTLTALIAVPEGASTPRVDWSMCLARKSLTELGPVNPLCLGLGAADEPRSEVGAGGAGDSAEPVDQVIPLGSGLSVKTALSADVCKLFGPLRPPPKMGQATGRPVDPDVTGGFYQPLVARLDGVPSLGAIRIDCDPANVNRDDALLYRRQYRVNEAPRLSSLGVRQGESIRDLANDERLEVKAGTRLSVRVGWLECPSESACGDGYCTADEDASNCAADCTAGQAHGCPGAEPYVWYNRETNRVEPRREGISVAWYASRGHFENEQTGLDEAEASRAEHTDNVWRVGPSSGDATVWVVVRDTRGGQSWRIQHFSVTP